MNTDGNTDAINRHLDEREDYDRMQELLAAEARVPELEDRIEELEAKLAWALDAFGEILQSSHISETDMVARAALKQIGEIND